MTPPERCPYCDHADRTGSWVDATDFDGMTHCRGCHGSWRRASEFQHCTGCHLTFTTVSAADKHRDGNRGCLDPATLRTRTGKPILARSTRQLPPGTTIELWSHAGENPRGTQRSASEGSA